MLNNFYRQALWQVALMRELDTIFRELLTPVRRWARAARRALPTYLPFYPLYLLVIVAGYAGWQALTPVTIIAPFQLPKADLPFSGEVVADTLRDALTSIDDDVKRENDDPRLRPTDMDLRELRNPVIPIIPKFERVQVPPSFSVEVKGLSYEGVISVARSVMRTETMVSGDVILNEKGFSLVARTADAGPWESAASPISDEGLRSATRDLAGKILAEQNPALEGAVLLKDGQFEKALAAFNHARTLKPADTRVELSLCTGFEATYQYQHAIECYKRMLSMKPSSPQEISERLAHAYWLNGKRDDAIKLFEKLAHQQGYRNALLRLGQARDDMGQHEAALKAYDEFLAGERTNRNLAIAYVNRGVALARLGKYDAAQTDFKKALQYAPDDVLILATKDVEMADAGDLDGGIARLQDVVEENENSDSVPFALLKLGILIQERGDWPHAGDQFRKATELQPNYALAHEKLAYALAHEDHQPEALMEYSKVARLSPSEVERRYSRVLANQWLGNALRNQENYSAAATAYREAIRLKPDYRAARCELGFVLERQGHLSQAIREYRIASGWGSKELDSNESLVLAHLRLGEVLVRMGRAHDAEGIAELRKAIELDSQRVESYLSLGNALYHQGNFVEAASVYREAIKIDPRSAAAYNGLGLVLDRQGSVDQAVLEYRSAVNLELDNPSYLANLAHELALEHLSKKVPNESEIVAKTQLSVNGSPTKHWPSARPRRMVPKSTTS